MSIKLYDLVGHDEKRPFSPHCWKVAFALAHKGLEFESVPARFRDIQSLEDGASRTVPLIRDGEQVISESFRIALYLDEAYPDLPPLFKGEGTVPLTRFIERWAHQTVYAQIARMILGDLFAILDEGDREYFRKTREARFGQKLEDVPVGREERLPAFRASLDPLRSMVERQAFIAGEEPCFADYIIAGGFQWARVSSSFQLLETDDPVAGWFERCLDLYGGLARSIAAAA
ncbi:glutathione S-transferase family protein [Nitratireductor basaltis]|nr:glutathione S-transferase family protein [Nitratireductor basaltis]